MNEEKSVSIVIPVFNAERYLRECLDSVVSQTYENLEIICVDDGSSDGSFSILEEYGRADKRIRLMKQEKESRTAALARNMGLEAATGDYLAFLDADDFLEENAIEEAVKDIENSRADITIFNAYIYETENNMDKFGNNMMKGWASQHEGVLEKDVIKTHILDLCTFAPWNKLYVRRYVANKQIRFRPVDPDDMEFGFLCLAEADRISILNKRLIHYRRGISGAQTNRLIEKIEPIYEPFIYLKEELENRGLMETFRLEFVRWFLMQFRSYAMQYKDKSLFDEAYYKLKEEKYLENFGIFDYEDKDLRSEMMVKFRNGMRYDTPEEFLFAITRQKDGVTSELCLCLPHKGKKKGVYRIALYGAGLYGKIYEEKFKAEPMIEVVCWLDQDYEQSAKLEPPVNIRNHEFDYVFVAIDDEEIYQDVKMFMAGQAIPQEKIVWMNDYQRGKK